MHRISSRIRPTPVYNADRVPQPLRRLSSWSSMFPAVATFLQTVLFPGDQSRSVLPFIPCSLRFIFLAVLIINVRSLPFAWHIRIFKYLGYLRLKGSLLSFYPRPAKEAWLESLSPVGISPFELKTTYVTWASLDDCDFYMHMSNSSYAKICDLSRMKYALQYLTPVLRDGVWIALGSTHYKFIREIPINATYEARLYLGSWDTKWVYVIIRFVSKRKGNATATSDDAKTRERIEGAKDALQLDVASPSNIPFPHLHTPAAPDASGFTTPNPLLLSSAEEFDSLWKEAPGETLHCIAVNEVCFKHGRVTVPPALTLAAAGCGLSQEKWKEVKKMRAGKEMRELLTGGWRKMPENERWWDEAIRPFEAERARRLRVVKSMHEGLEATRSL